MVYPKEFYSFFDSSIHRPQAAVAARARVPARVCERAGAHGERPIDAADIE